MPGHQGGPARPDTKATVPVWGMPTAGRQVQVIVAGRVELTLDCPLREGTTSVVMRLLELMQRLAATVPQPVLLVQQPTRGTKS